MTDQPTKVALVTGASRGIGRATAIKLAAEGYHVILTARTEKDLIATDDIIHDAGGTSTIAPMNLVKSEEIDRLASAVTQRWGHLDLLVLNAGTLGSLAPLAHSTPKEFDEVMNLNVTAQWRLMRAFDGLLRVARGTVVAVSSAVANRDEAYWGPYAASKAALEKLISTYGVEMQALGVNALIVDPGRTRTDMRAKAFPGEDPMSIKGPETVADAIVGALAQMGPGASRLLVGRDGTPEFTAAA